MSKNVRNVAYAFLSVYFAVFLAIICYANRYDLGLVKPRFKVGDCVVWTYKHGEFLTNTWCNRIETVGKTSYLYSLWIPEYKKYAAGLEEFEIKDLDSWGRLSDVCGK